MWRLQIQRTTEEQEPQIVGEFTNPAVMHKRCSLSDQSDLLDQMLEQDRKIQQSGLSFSALNDIADDGHRRDIERRRLTFPIKNKTKSQNQVLTNFMFEANLKQETFLLTFDIGDSHCFPVDSNLSNTEFLFNINGTVHG